ncbi:MAG: T9SS type A sorting domain-containing protein [Bacteroidia bacterium]
MIRKLLLLLLLTPCLSQGQISFDWVRNHQVNYSMNPGIPKAMVCKGSGSDVWFAYYDSVVMSWSLDPVGRISLLQKDDFGTTLQTLQLTSNVILNDMVTDQQGRLYVIGTFMDTLWINQSDTLINTGPALNTDPFILCFEPNGQLRWKRNLGGGFGTSFISPTLKVSPFGEVYYAYTDFSTGYIIHLDSTGAPLGQVVVDGIRTIGDFSFTPTGGMYVAGATGIGSTVSIGGVSQLATDSYMFYIAYTDHLGNGQWIHLAHDVTFQTPRIATDPFGNAYVSAMLMDTITWGNWFLQGPDWVFDFWLVKVDSTGSFHWAKECPNPPGGIVGDFEITSGRSIDCDANGNVMLYGLQRGAIDWGNGLFISNGPVSQSNFTAILFDSAGIALQGKYAVCTVPKYAYNVVNNGQSWYLSGGSTTETGVLFDTILVDFPFGQNAYLAKIIPTPVGVQEISETTATIYPNPGHSIFYVPETWTNRAPTGIFDLRGRCVYQQILQTSHLDLSHLDPGVYFARNNEATVRFVKE